MRTSSANDSPPGRPATFADLTSCPLDLLVLGGGIVGAGIARDAALRGWRTGLVEQHDFASGTSSRSSRLLHGGLRYLAQGRIGLVREASVEKTILHRIAPHLAQPLPFLFPTYRDNRHWVLWQLKIGVKLYDLLCGGRNLGHSTWLRRSQVLESVPGLRPDLLTGAVRYFDGFTQDARLTLDTLRSAARHGALLANDCRFNDASPGELWDCQVVDAHTQESHRIQARAVVNATGPWADRVPHSQVRLRLTKGVHLVVDHGRVPVSQAVVLTEGKRILFAIPWGERCILGTTDTDYQGTLDAVRTDPADVAYILDITNRFFPAAALTPSDVVSCWAGLRPLIADPDGSPSDVSRSHQISNPEPGWWDVAGGKLTTYRLMAEQTVNAVAAARQRGQGPGPNPGCAGRTSQEPLLDTAEEARFSGILPPPIERAAVEHYCRREWALHLEDVMLRRSSWHYYERDAATVAHRVAEWMSPLLGWSPTRREEELARYRRAVGWQPTAPSEAPEPCARPVPER